MRKMISLISLVFLPMLCISQSSGGDQEMIDLITVSKEDLHRYKLIKKSENKALYNDPVKDRGIAIYYADHDDDGQKEENLTQLIYEYEHHELGEFLEFFNDEFKKVPQENNIWIFIPDHEDWFYEIELVMKDRAFYLLIQQNDFVR